MLFQKPVSYTHLVGGQGLHGVQHRGHGLEAEFQRIDSVEDGLFVDVYKRQLHILLSRQQYRQHSLLDVQSIFCLGEDLVGVCLEDSGRDLLAAVSGQAVELSLIHI